MILMLGFCRCVCCLIGLGCGLGGMFGLGVDLVLLGSFMGLDATLL